MWYPLVVIAIISTVVEQSLSISTTMTDRLGYPVNSLLVCHVNNPYYYLPGQPPVVPEEPLKLTLLPGQRGRVWLPESSRYLPPIINGGNIDTATLVTFLGQDYRGQLLSISKPPPGSIPPLPGLSSTSDLGSGGGMFMPSTAPAIFDSNLFNFVGDLLRITGQTFDAGAITNDLLLAGIDNCALKSNWTELPLSYFPRYISGGYCTDSAQGSCSIPSGLHCIPRTNPDSLTYIPILRWDCCNTYTQNQWKWSCGWRKVLIPLISHCICGCA